MRASLLLHASTPLRVVERGANNLRHDMLTVADHPSCEVDVDVKLRGNALELIGTCYLVRENIR
jgi:hypothetical protein